MAKSNNLQSNKQQNNKTQQIMFKVAPFPPKEDISPLFSKGGFRGNVNTSLLLLKHN